MKAVYAGTFDPFTIGHENILTQALPFFSEIIIAVGVNPEKPNSLFSVDQRLSFIRTVANHYEVTAEHKINYGKFDITGPHGMYLVEYAEEMEAEYIIRGLRSVADFEYELSMMKVNRRISPKIQTMFFVTEFGEVSSSLVRGMIGPTSWPSRVKSYIPEPMWDTFLRVCSMKGLVP